MSSELNYRICHCLEIFLYYIVQFGADLNFYNKNDENITAVMSISLKLNKKDGYPIEISPLYNTDISIGSFLFFQ